jgi:hypothetical protein
MKRANQLSQARGDSIRRDGVRRREQCKPDDAMYQNLRTCRGTQSLKPAA